MDTQKPRPDTISLIARTRKYRIAVAEAARTRVYRDSAELPAERGRYLLEDYAQQTLAFDLQQGRPVRVEKLVVFYTSRDKPISEPLTNAEEAVGRFSTFHASLRRHPRASAHS